MFTGIVSHFGIVSSANTEGQGTSFQISPSSDFGEVHQGMSIACSGACLTVTEFGEWGFSVDASKETFQRTTLGEWKQGTKVNLERPLKLGDELGGHFVLGHVDGVAEVSHCSQDGNSKHIKMLVPNNLEHLIAEKGSITLDGVSLTVNKIVDQEYNLNIVPHTLAATTFNEIGIGSRLNIEIDPIARYLARLQESVK